MTTVLLPDARTFQVPELQLPPSLLLLTTSTVLTQVSLICVWKPQEQPLTFCGWSGIAAGPPQKPQH